MREQRRMSADDVIDGRDVVLSRCAQRSARCPPYLRPRHAYLHLYPGVRHVVAIDRGGRRISHRRVIFVVFRCRVLTLLQSLDRLNALINMLIICTGALIAM